MRIPIAKLQEAAAEHFRLRAPDALASDAMSSIVQQIDAMPSVLAQAERVRAFAGILTTLLFAAEETGLANNRSYLTTATTATQALRWMRQDAAGAAVTGASADSVARCFAAFWEALRLSKIWSGQVKSVAWRRIQAKVIQ